MVDQDPAGNGGRARHRGRRGARRLRALVVGGAGVRSPGAQAGPGLRGRGHPAGLRPARGVAGRGALAGGEAASTGPVTASVTGCGAGSGAGARAVAAQSASASVPGSGRAAVPQHFRGAASHPARSEPSRAIPGNGHVSPAKAGTGLAKVPRDIRDIFSPLCPHPGEVECGSGAGEVVTSDHLHTSRCIWSGRPVARQDVSDCRMPRKGQGWPWRGEPSRRRDGSRDAADLHAAAIPRKG